MLYSARQIARSRGNFAASVPFWSRVIKADVVFEGTAPLFFFFFFIRRAGDLKSCVITCYGVIIFTVSEVLLGFSSGRGRMGVWSGRVINFGTCEINQERR